MLWILIRNASARQFYWVPTWVALNKWDIQVNAFYFSMKRWQHYSLNPWHIKYVEGYVDFAFPFVYLYVHSFLCSSYRHVRGTRVKSFCVQVYKTLHYKDPLMDFIYIWYDDRYRFYSVPSPTQGLTLKTRSRNWNFHIKIKIFALYFIQL